MALHLNDENTTVVLRCQTVVCFRSFQLSLDSHVKKHLLFPPRAVASLVWRFDRRVKRQVDAVPGACAVPLMRVQVILFPQT